MTAGTESKKAQLRVEMRRCSPEWPRVDSGRIFRQVWAIPEQQSARVVMCYAPLKDELRVPLIDEVVTEGRIACVPRITGDRTMEAVAVPDDPPAPDSPEERTGWQRGRYGLWEPTGPRIDLSIIDFALVPGLAFTRDGKRLGRGKGFYDRFLAQLRPDCFKCGVGYDFQLLDDLPTEPHDVLLDAVVTPSGVYRRTRSPSDG